MPAYRFHCRNPKCGGEFHRYYPITEFEQNQYHSSVGWACFNCGFPKMAVIKSNKSVKDGFVPGWQPNIRKVCNTYSEYKAWLKKMNLIEFGYEDIQPMDSDDYVPNYWTDDILKEVYDMGIQLSGRTIDALKEGRVEELDE